MELFFVCLIFTHPIIKQFESCYCDCDSDFQQNDQFNQWFGSDNLKGIFLLRRAFLGLEKESYENCLYEIIWHTISMNFSMEII